MPLGSAMRPVATGNSFVWRASSFGGLMGLANWVQRYAGHYQFSDAGEL